MSVLFESKLTTQAAFKSPSLPYQVIGGDLFDRIATKTVFTEKDARDLVALLLRTVAYIHGKGIVHCDLKPENLLLTTQV